MKDKTGKIAILTSNWIRNILIILGVPFFAYIISLFDTFQDLERKLYDMAFQMRGTSPLIQSDITIVAIDQETLDSLSYPFNRIYYADLIRKLNKLGARVIIFDVDFSSVGLIPESDSIFYAAIEEADNVILSGMISYKHRRGLRDPIAEAKAPSNRVIPQGTPWGLVNEVKDPDGFTRRYCLFLTIGDKAYLSLGLKAFSQLNGLDSTLFKFSSRGDLIYGGLTIPRVDFCSCLLNYFGPAGTFPTYSFLSVLRGEYDFEDLLAGLSAEETELLAASGMSDLLAESPFKNKVVFVGASAEDLQDNKFSPFFSQEQLKTPGVETHANALQMFNDNTFIRTVGFYWTILCTLLLSVIVLVVEKQKHPWLALLSVCVIFVLLLVFNFWLFSEHRYWLHGMPLLLTVGIGYPVNLVHRLIRIQREKARMRGMFAHYLNEKVVKELEADPGKLALGGEVRIMSVLFCDVVGFTSISEKLSPEELVHLLNEYLTEMTNIVLANEGIIDKYGGDLLMAEFGAPIWYENHALNSCYSALQMQERLAEMRWKWRAEGRDELYSRIGINTGEMIVGNMGSEEVFDYTVMGDSVNLASRLEGANKSYRTSIMIGFETWEDVKDRFVTRPLDFLRVKGKTEPETVFELLAEKPEKLSAAKLRALELFEQGIKLYRQGEFEDALIVFRKALGEDPDDGPARVYVDRCEQYIYQPPDEDWDGVWTLTEK